MNWFRSTSKIRLVVLVCVAWSWASAASAQVTAEAVQHAIDRGVAFLKKQQSAETGGWQEYTNQSCGLSALCTLALLNCGLDHNDPAVARALDYLRQCEPKRTYSISLQTMVFCQARQARDLATIRTNVRLLENLMIRRDDGPMQPGGWPYQTGQGNGDPSNSQFALLALSAAEERGVAVSKEVFEIAEDYWLRRQQRQGGWTYSSTAKGAPASGSMTCAGIASLVITRGRTGKSQARIEKGMIQCCGADIDERDPIQAGLDWLGKNFLVSANPGVRVHGLYYLYALERVGRLTGHRLIGGHDWYREGAEYLLKRQDGFEGFWRGVGHDDSIPTVGTSFALLFLAKGKRQVVISRLQHGVASDWNWHPDALRQLTHHVERKWQQDLTWQTVQLAGASVEELLKSPILFISGSGPLVTTAQQREALKQYVEQGGFIFAQATAASGCQPSREFEQSLRQLVEELFDAPLEKLPVDHPIWHAEYRLKPTKMPDNFWLYGVQACCRTSIVYSPVSLACLWELSDPTGRRELPDRWKPAIETAAHLGQNVIAYATGRRLRDKLDGQTVLVPQTDLAMSPRNTLIVPQLEIGAGGDEAPRALPNLMEWMRRQVATEIASPAEMAGFDAKTLQDYSIVFMHGRYSFTLTEAQRNVLRDFLTGGGTIFAGAICGNDEFTQSFRREMQLVLPGVPLSPLAADHEAFTSRFRGYNLSSVTLRKPVEGESGIVVSQKVGAPLIEVMRQDDRDCVFFSPFDLSCALENQGGIQCAGYDTVDAAKIGINLILYAMLQ
ncbi:DUF4159 domain-containing protein [Rosistilla oblonga]|uniref:DUF4159 domain-containing protein n=1 Tax=Rosistilla oblonga TaxID=2527990 RepID=UPI003A97B093